MDTISLFNSLYVVYATLTFRLMFIFIIYFILIIVRAGPYFIGALGFFFFLGPIYIYI